MEHLLEVKNLSVSIDGPAGEVQAVRNVSFSLKKGEVLAIVGESGCGKSVLCKSIMKLLPPSAKIKEGSICVNGQDITCYREIGGSRRMTNHLFELAGNRKTETVIPKSKKKWYQGKPVVSAAILILIVLGCLRGWMN